MIILESNGIPTTAMTGMIIHTGCPNTSIKIANRILFTSKIAKIAFITIFSLSAIFTF